LETFDLPGSDLPNDETLVVRVVFKPESEATMRQEMELIKTVLDEVIADMKAEAEAAGSSPETPSCFAQGELAANPVPSNHQ
jgi:hypothetical protein